MTPDEIQEMLTARESDRLAAREQFIRDLARDPERQADRRERGMPSIEQLDNYVPPEQVGDVIAQRIALAKLQAGAKHATLEDMDRIDAERAHILAELARTGHYSEPRRPVNPVFELP